ncbi:unnamed protein product [Ceratitis capitata]|uniref:(Mediterranean fruit fly) hypothetical protein n=1 Tax=Ceratitis capitata TaxID=7213 RepID=A0A811UXQ1_CERCA|nr:unnamed protein product [Ceratitis capitata]
MYQHSASIKSMSGPSPSGRPCVCQVPAYSRTQRRRAVVKLSVNWLVHYFFGTKQPILGSAFMHAHTHTHTHMPYMYSSTSPLSTSPPPSLCDLRQPYLVDNETDDRHDFLRR